MADTHLGLKKSAGEISGLRSGGENVSRGGDRHGPKKELLEICQFLHPDPDLQYHFLTDLCGLDFFPEAPRFEVVYLLYSMKNNERLEAKDESCAKGKSSRAWNPSGKRPTGWNGRCTTSSESPLRITPT